MRRPPALAPEAARWHLDEWCQVAYGVGQGERVASGPAVREPGAQLAQREGFLLDQLSAHLRHLRQIEPFELASEGVLEAPGESVGENRPQSEAVVRGDEVDRAAHQGDPHHLAAPHEPGEVLDAEAGQSGPQPDVGRVGRLGLHADQVRDRCDGRRLHPSGEHLAGQQTSVERSAAQHARVPRRHEADPLTRIARRRRRWCFPAASPGATTGRGRVSTPSPFGTRGNHRVPKRLGAVRVGE